MSKHLKDQQVTNLPKTPNHPGTPLLPRPRPSAVAPLASKPIRLICAKPPCAAMAPSTPPLRPAVAGGKSDGYGRSYFSVALPDDGQPSATVCARLKDILDLIREGLDYFEKVHAPANNVWPEFRIMVGFETLIQILRVVGLPAECASRRGELSEDTWLYLRELRDALHLSDSFLGRMKEYRNATAHAEPWKRRLDSPEADCENLRLLVVEVFFALKEWSATAKARTTSELAKSFYRYLRENDSLVERLPPAA